MTDPWKILNAITLGVVLTEVVRHGEGFVTYAEWMQWTFEGRCVYCGYLKTHPIIRHDEQGGECGWR